MKEKNIFNFIKKLSKYFIFQLTAIILILTFVGLFFVDIGINSKFFIKKHFTKAFEYRISGDCVSFSNYFNQNNEEWKYLCEIEKNYNSIESIRSFKIQNISHNFGSNYSFLQVELTKNSKDGKNYSHLVNYEMKKIDFKWIIDTEKNNTNETNKKQIYDKIASDDEKTAYLVEILKMMDTKEQKNKFIKEMDISSEVKNKLKDEIKKGVFEKKE